MRIASEISGQGLSLFKFDSLITRPALSACEIFLHLLTLGAKGSATQYIRVISVPLRSASLLRVAALAVLQLLLVHLGRCSRQCGRTGSDDDPLNVS